MLAGLQALHAKLLAWRSICTQAVPIGQTEHQIVLSLISSAAALHLITGKQLSCVIPNIQHQLNNENNKLKAENELNDKSSKIGLCIGSIHKLHRRSEGKE